MEPAGTVVTLVIQSAYVLILRIFHQQTLFPPILNSKRQLLLLLDADSEGLGVTETEAWVA
eukprot:1348726-Rhodomonas_salina.2